MPFHSMLEGQRQCKTLQTGPTVFEQLIYFGETKLHATDGTHVIAKPVHLSLHQSLPIIAVYHEATWNEKFVQHLCI